MRRGTRWDNRFHALEHFPIVADDQQALTLALQLVQKGLAVAPV